MSVDRIRIKIEAYDHEILDQAVANIVQAIRKTAAQIYGPIPLPTKIERYTVLRSPHVDKKSREQFEIRTHRRLIEITDITPKTMETIQVMNLPAGVDVKVKPL